MEDFHERLNKYIINALVNNIPDNWDILRYPQQNILSPNEKLISQILTFYKENSTTLNLIADNFSDNISSNIFMEWLAFRCLGPEKIRLSSYSRYESNLKFVNDCKSSYSVYEAVPFTLSLYEVPFINSLIKVNCWNLNVYLTFAEKQYFLERNPDITIRPEKEDVILDLGGCFGDTSLAFASAVGKYGHIYCFEPLPRHQDIIRANLQLNPDLAQTITLVPHAVSSVHKAQLSFKDGGAGSNFGDGEVNVVTCTIDDFVCEQNIKKLDFIKFDIEKAELEALEGGMSSILKFRPKLTVSVYHGNQYLDVIPFLIKNLPDYKFYLETHTIHAEEAVLYCSPCKV